MKIAQSASSTTPQRYVVLDLDHTLICAKPQDALQKPIEDERTFFVRTISIQTLLRVVKRKYMTHFLDELDRRNYKIIVWSAGADSYVKDIVSVVFNGRKLEYVLTANHLSAGNYKDLSIISSYVEGFLPENCRLIDDSVGHSFNQEKMCIIVNKFIFDGPMPLPKEDDDLFMNLADGVDASFSS